MSTTNESRVWFVTGSSTGFGRELVEEALAQGDRVVATARKPETLEDLTRQYPQTAKAIRLDVTKPGEAVAAVEEAVAAFGRIDVLVNNAGYGLIGALEEVSDEDLRRQFETNVFGVVNVLRAALPVLRKQRSGHILNLSSVGGFVSFPATSPYAATKFAVEAFSEALSQELAHLNIKVTIIEPGAFRTDFNGRSLVPPSQPLADYPVTPQFLNWIQEMDGKQPGDPRKAARAMIKVVAAEKPPVRLPLGEDAITLIEAKLEAVKQELAEWRQTGVETAFDGLTAGTIGG